MKKYISSKLPLLFIIGLAFATQSCFQDLDQNPDFNYPEQPAPATYSPQKLALTFEEEAKDQSNYKINTSVKGGATFVTGKSGKAYQGSSDSYILITPNPAAYTGDISVRDTIANLGSFTIAFWMKTEQASAATGIFSISNTKKFWGNLDIFLEGNASSPDEAFIKLHLYNGVNEKWVETRIAGSIGDWVHLAFRYDATTKQFDIFKNGELAVNRDFTGFGQIAYNDMGQIVVGALQFQTDPSLTEATGKQDWARNFTGLLDNFYLYNKPISDADIKTIAQN
ncbi:MAG: LamG-like jellyroll fold domain-containing protein [Capnocytophaga sp.]|nr:LamG-like jellyroll fold domain-containing protein [Capnocytophaga sp.]